MTEPVDPVWGIKLTPEEIQAAIGGSPSASSQRSHRWPDLSEGDALDDSDLECLADIKAALERHGKAERFGVSLLHEHFPLEKGEVMVEKTDKASRTMTQSPQVLDPGDVTLVDTQWYLGASMPLSLVKCRTSMHV